MIKTVHKMFWMWDFEGEEKWLNEMSAKGLVLHSVGFCRYEFEECAPGEYRIFSELTENISSAERENYIRFLEETGVEHVCSFYRWNYYRTKSENAEELFSDNESKIKYLTRLFRFYLFFLIFESYICLYNLFVGLFLNNNAISPVNLVCAGLLAVISVFFLIGTVRIAKKRRKLKKEQEIFE